ncbi:hypothetical protein LUZ60_005006 [Juncus effusus]|nr:hypothetical protein LUZ60_005006 [Juncus effusus]
MLTHLLFLLLTLIPPSSSSPSCNRQCGKTTVPYPFGFSSTCGIPLSCISKSSISFSTFPLHNFTSNNTFLLSVPTNCTRPIGSLSSLFGKNYAMTWRNGLFLRNCTPSVSPPCLLPTVLISQMSHFYESCGKKGDNITCVSNGTGGLFLSEKMVVHNGCSELFTSVLYETMTEGQTALVLGVVEVGWWLSGDCRCSANASCTRVGNDGFQCMCNQGFVGDGFAEGKGCVKVSKCGAKGGSSCKHVQIGVIIGGIAGGISLTLALIFLCIIFCRRFNKRLRSSKDYQITTKWLLSEASCSVPLYSYREIERATNSFAETHKLGTGAYGTVYVGKLPVRNNSMEDLVAIKRIRYRADQDSINQVMNEIKLISSVDHPNLVKLLGCCIDRGEQILIYEFMPNGTLAEHLRPETGRESLLPWFLRLSISAETAKAIEHLHFSLHPPIYHRDIKSSNILLDHDFNPKVADFGLSRAGRAELSHISTAPQGTPGYLDPEYHQNFHLSDKSDVYSFGVVLLEIITGMKVVDFNRPASEINLASLAIDRIAKGRVEEIVDPILVKNEMGNDDWLMDSVKKVAELAFRCLAFNKDVRPCMNEVASELERIRADGPQPDPLDGGEEMEKNRELNSVISVEGILMESSRSEGRRSLKADFDSPVCVQGVWISEQSSPSTNGSMPRFAA